MSVDGYEVFHFISVGLLFMTLVASFTLSILAVIRLRIQRDPARKVFSWAKAAWLIFLIAVVSSFCQIALATITARYYEISGYDDQYNDYDVGFIARITTIADTVSRFLNTFAEIIIFLTMVTFKRCIDVAHIGGTHKVKKWPRRTAYATAIILTIFALFSFSMVLYINVSSAISASNSNIEWQISYATWQMPPFVDLGVQCTLALTSLIMTIYAIVMKRRCRYNASLRKPTTYFVACMFMWLLRSAFYIYLILFNLTISPFYSAPINVLSTFNEILQVIFVTWPIFILLTLIYALGVHKTHSLRSVEQPPLMQEIESQTAVATAADTEPTSLQTSTPMTENAPTEISVTEASHNPFPWDGLSDAPPEYTPAAVRRRPVPTATELPVSEMSQQQSAATSHLHPTLAQTQAEAQPLGHAQSDAGQSQSELPSTALASDSSTLPELEQPLPGLGQHIPTIVEPSSGSQPSQYIAGMQAAEMSAEPPSHDEAMGLYHQADGIMPRSETIPCDEKK